MQWHNQHPAANLARTLQPLADCLHDITMNDNINGATAPLANGDGATEPQPLFQIVEALEAVHSAQSTNESRKQASIFLEQAKTSREAPYHGFTLASDRSQSPVVRHFALSLLEYAIKHNWTEYSLEQSNTLKGWVLQLAQDVNGQDPLYVRNKIAQLWVELAKRSWASEWMDMDELLVRLWAGPLVQKELVLLVLETLSEDVFNREDSAAALRGTQLNKACVDVFTPASVLAENFPARDTDVNVRFGDEGWLARFGDLLEWCLRNGVGTDEEVRSCAIKTLAALRAAMQWVMHKATAAVNCTEHICKSLAAPSVPVQMAAVETLHALYSRTYFQDDEFLALVCPMYSAESVNLLKRLYEWSVVDATSIGEEKYLLSKKFSEMISHLGNFIEQKPLLIPVGSDMPGFLNLMLNIMNHQSMTVSLPVLSTWVKLLRSDTTGQSDAFNPLVGSLLDICSRRLIKYESLPEDSDDPSLVFLLEDIDTMPERHAFVGIYRRYCVQVVETIVKRRPFDAMCHILAQTSHSLKTLYDGQPTFQAETYAKNSIPALRVDAHFTVVEAALKGYVKWVDSHGSRPQRDEIERSTTEDNLESWCEQLLGMNFQDPLIKKRVLQLAVTFSTTALDKRAGFMLKVLEHILMTRPEDNQAYPVYSDAVRDLQNDCTHELHRLAMKMPDHLLRYQVVYNQLEAKVNDIIAGGGLDDRQRLAFFMFLFIITTLSHRATSIDSQLRESRLQSFVTPIRLSWQDAELTRSISTFQGFCNLLGLGKVQEYLVSRQVHKIEEWSQYQLDAEGRAIQTELNERFQLLPLRPTKSFIGVSNDKLVKGSATYNTACALWQDVIPVILPNLLQFLSHCHAFHNPLNWTGLPEELRPIVTRVLTDRFWQAGISSGSKDDFYARVGNTRTTMEGFASSIRGTVRMVRETCYSILFCMSRLDIHFYGFVELPGPLARALFADAHALSSHQMSVLLNVARFLVDDCPVNLRAHFLPPILASLFAQVDNKVSSEWEQLMEKAQATSDNDGLTQEMKEESILRQLTYSAVLMVAGLLDPQRETKPHAAEGVAQALVGNSSPTQLPKIERRHSMRDFILSSDAILAPLLEFCTHALRLRDQRCCSVIIRVFRSIVSKFSEDRPDIREFICNEVLRASITSLHEDYFVDLQRELAQLIATIFILYSPHSNTPRQILLSLPGIEEHKLDQVAKQLLTASSGRQQRALILDLLQGLRGQSIAEQGQIARPPQNSKSAAREKRTALQHLMTGGQEANRNRAGTPDLGGLVDMFH
ncbi:hypothetical protein FGG08_003492 [Glutinoglossum americanum]|uniref:Importin N-terminal domain-containing protein n=1 Tax=Glutinoglossum americanum TaxID=1670608 RepID=A0A9P8L3M3_9PEZI|nr:hypothetical protein FGG08_003492 [Glutinoglossum americanum]